MTMEKPKMPRMTRCIKYHPALPWINASRKNSTAQAKRMTDWNLVLPLCWPVQLFQCLFFRRLCSRSTGSLFLGSGFFLGAGLEVFLEDADFFANVMCLSERNCRQNAGVQFSRRHGKDAVLPLCFYLMIERLDGICGENPSGR